MNKVETINGKKQGRVRRFLNTHASKILVFELGMLTGGLILLLGIRLVAGA